MRILFVVSLLLGVIACQGEKPKAPASKSGPSEYGIEATSPDGSPVVMDISESPSLGNPGAEVVVVEYTNFFCKPCARMAKTLNALAKEHPEEIQLIFKHGLLGDPARSYPVHEAAQAAYAQGKFWEYKELLFSHQMAYSPEELKSYAKEAGLDLERFTRDLATHAHRGVVERDFYEAELFGHRGTPVVYINGKGYFGVSDVEVRATIEAALREACGADLSC